MHIKELERRTLWNIEGIVVYLDRNCQPQFRWKGECVVAGIRQERRERVCTAPCLILQSEVNCVGERHLLGIPGVIVGGYPLAAILPDAILLDALFLRFHPALPCTRHFLNGISLYLVGISLNTPRFQSVQCGTLLPTRT